MQYLITFLEGIITFISPCMLPMLPVYFSYFSGGEPGTKKALKNAVAFVTGFTVIFIMLGLFAGTIGSFFTEHKRYLNIIAGILLVIFGLNFLGIIRVHHSHCSHHKISPSGNSLFSSLIMGVIFSMSFSPCVSTFVGSALILASHQGSPLMGMGLLFCYSAGIGIPFIISSVIIDKLKSSFEFVKKHSKITNTICGLLLILFGLLMATGLFDTILELFHHH
ncbi:MAG: cytochrome c biogenesis protein CcdA [Clostridia bacterium]|nr:cytochrome c biogenesis protein CcdA [Clostridia bacterium]